MSPLFPIQYYICISLTFFLLRPIAKIGHGHIFNNLFDDNNDGINTRDGAQLLVQNNVWTGTDKPLYATDEGFAVATGNGAYLLDNNM